MNWPKELHPKTTRYALIENLHKLKFKYVILLLLTGYVLLNLFFSFLYYLNDYLHDNVLNTKLEYIYFSFITGSTIGFGESIELYNFGKHIVMFQGLLSTLYFALMVSFLSIKALYPYHTIHFSDKIIFNEDRLIFRITNSHRALLINPEIRITVVEHCYGNVIATNFSVPKIDNLHWLDNHDMSITFSNKLNNTKNISDEWIKAKKCNEKSRFKIKVSIIGIYGSQQYSQVVCYDKNDIEIGRRFKAISYTDEDKRLIRNIRYKKFGNFWEDFNQIII